MTLATSSTSFSTVGSGEAAIGRQRSIGGEQLRIVGRLAAFDGDQRVEELPQPLRRRARLRGDGPQRRHGRLHPSADDQVQQLGLGRHVAVEGRMAHAQCPCHVHHVRLGQAEPTDDLLGRGEDPIAGERRVSGGHSYLIASRPKNSTNSGATKGWIDAVGLPFECEPLCRRKDLDERLNRISHPCGARTAIEDEHGHCCGGPPSGGE